MSEVTYTTELGGVDWAQMKATLAADDFDNGRTRHAVLSEWVGPGVLPTSPERHAYQGLKPRSKDPAFVRQMMMTFPEMSAARG